MHIDITTTVSLKDDDNREVTRIVSKGRTSSFSLEDEPPGITRRLSHAFSLTKHRAQAGIDSILVTLRS